VLRFALPKGKRVVDDDCPCAHFVKAECCAHARGSWFDVSQRQEQSRRNLKNLITLLEELQALGIAFVSLAEGIDATTPAGKLQGTSPA
jgi:hypothetical protein